MPARRVRSGQSEGRRHLRAQQAAPLQNREEQSDADAPLSTRGGLKTRPYRELARSRRHITARGI